MNAALAGLAGGIGLTLVWWWIDLRRPRLAVRVGTHMREREPAAWLRSGAPVTPFPTVERLLAPVMHDAARWLARWHSPASATADRLARAGMDLSVDQFRAQQVLSVAGGLAGGLVIATVLALTRPASPVALVIVVAVCALGALMARDWMLSRRIAQREERIEEQLPTIAELIALSVSAGEGVRGALERVARTASGAMADELTVTLNATRAGVPLANALHAMGERTGVQALRRFADGVATAVERGTPLADVVRAQAQDVREAGRRALMEEGGKKEIAMMIPVIFLILPVTVLFAVFPGIATIQLGF